MATLLRGLGDLLFPPVCQACHTAGAFPLCTACRAGFRLIRPPVCRKCGKPLHGPPDLVFTCIPCRHRRFYFTCARAVGVYEGLLREAIHALKFDRCQALAEPLGQMMAEMATTDRFLSGAEVIVAIPLHHSRLRERGFNQAELLASTLARELHLPLVTDLVRRNKPTEAQSGLSEGERRLNVRNAFTMHKTRRPRRLLLVDDVFATGSTVSECARVMRRAGIHAVSVLTLARTVLE